MQKRDKNNTKKAHPDRDFMTRPPMEQIQKEGTKK